MGFTKADVLYSASSNSNKFFQINTTPPDPLATTISNIPGFLSSGDIVFNPSSGQFLATSETPNDSTLFSIALDGTATQIGNIGFKDVLGLFFEAGTLYGYTFNRQQIIIDLNTGVGTFDKLVTGGTGGIAGAASLATTVPSTKPTDVPEPNSLLGLLSLSAFGIAIVKRKQKQLLKQ